MEYRPISPASRDDYRRIARYAFEPESGPGLDGNEEDGVHALGDRRGLFAGEELVCVCKQYWHRLRVRGEFRDVAGLAAVASPPEHRRQGNAARLLAESLVEYRERDHHLVTLGPFDWPFYAKYGWATANDTSSTSVRPKRSGSEARRPAVDSDA